MYNNNLGCSYRAFSSPRKSPNCRSSSLPSRYTLPLSGNGRATYLCNALLLVFIEAKSTLKRALIDSSLYITDSIQILLLRFSIPHGLIYLVDNVFHIGHTPHNLMLFAEEQAKYYRLLLFQTYDDCCT